MESTKKKEGGQKGNKNAETWTEEAALELGHSLIKWLTPDLIEGKGDVNEGNIFFEEYIVIRRGLTPRIANYLCNKFESFSTLYAQAKKIQEIKLVKYGVADRLNASMTKFVLVNNHDWSDKKELEHGGEVRTAVTGYTIVPASEHKNKNEGE